MFDVQLSCAVVKFTSVIFRKRKWSNSGSLSLLLYIYLCRLLQMNKDYHKSSVDGTFCPRCHITMNSTQTPAVFVWRPILPLPGEFLRKTVVLDSGLLAPWYQSMTLSTKPDVSQEEKERVTARDNMHQKFGEVLSCGLWDNTSEQTNRHTHYNNAHAFGGNI